MKAAIVTATAKTPMFGDFADPQVEAGEVRIAVTAAALSQIVRSRASGNHYSTSGRLPFVAGIDGVGRLEDGRRVYFALPRAPFGSMAEWAPVRREQCVAVPDDLDDVTAAAIANPGMSSWAALKERAKFAEGETVLINGATGTAGRLAIQIAKYLGAKKVIATGRNATALESLAAIGADFRLPLTDDLDFFENTLHEQFSAGVDVVLDYLWGVSAQRVLIAAAKSAEDAKPIRYVHIGAVSGNEIQLPSQVLRSSAIELMGSGIGSVPLERMIGAVEELLRAVIPGRFEIATKTVPLEQVEEAWAIQGSSPRMVFTV
jgi:NADPH:quinone reductase-like Zn-dependent oxidoreductase